MADENLTVRLWDVIHDARSTLSGHAPTSAIVAAVLPILAEEARKAKAEALREAAEQARSKLGWASGGHTSTHSVRHWLRKLATEYETGDSDEHR